MRAWTLLGGVTLLFACGGAAPQRIVRTAPRVARAQAPIVEAPSPCASLGAGAHAVLFDRFFRAHAEGRIDADLVDAGGGRVDPTPLATELLCPTSVHTLEQLPGGRERVALVLRAGRAGETFETEALLSPDGERRRIESDSLSRIRGDVTSLQVRRFLREHPEIEQLGAIDVPFEDDFPDATGVSPRRRVRDALNLRLAFARESEGTTLCLLSARAGSAATRSWCWRTDARLAGVVVGAPMIVDDNVQLQIVLVPVAPARRAEVVELRFGDMNIRHLDDVPVRAAPIVPAWAERAREGVILPGAFRPHTAEWSPVEAAGDPPPWIALLSSSPWLRAVPIPSPAGHAATSITVDREESRRWLAIHAPAGWALSAPLQSPSRDGLTSWDGIVAGNGRNGAAEGAFLASSSEFGEGHGTAHRRVLVVGGDRLNGDAPALVGRVRAWWSSDTPAPPDPVTDRMRAPMADDTPHRVVWRAQYSLTPGPAPGCWRARLGAAEVVHATRDFHALPGRPVVEFDPATLPPSLDLGPLPDTGAPCAAP